MAKRAEGHTDSNRAAGLLAQASIDATIKRTITELLNKQDASPTIVVVAHRLHMNVRTLQRRLEVVGTPFRSLLRECREHRARRDLCESKRAIKDVAMQLGYSDAAHFARAFRRWTGSSPIEYRRRCARQKRSPQ